jgi:phosphoglycolate phosphatase
MARRFDLAIFDLDGTLADTAPDIERALNKAMADFGRPPVPHERVLRSIGAGAKASCEAILPGEDLERAAEIVTRYREYYDAANTVWTQPFAGIDGALEALRAGGVKMAVASNKRQPQSEQIIRELGLMGYFSDVFGPEDVERPKPEPDMLKLTMERCGVGPDRSVMVGDTVYDVAAGRASGATTALVTWGYVPVDEIDRTLVDRVVSSPRELVDMVVGSTTDPA